MNSSVEHNVLLRFSEKLKRNFFFLKMNILIYDYVHLPNHITAPNGFNSLTVNRISPSLLN